MTDFWQDIRHAVRLLMRSPGFTLTALLTLVITIGANTAVFSVVYGVLLKPLPYPEPEQLVFVWNGIEPSRSDVLNMDALDEFQRINHSFEAVSAFHQTSSLAGLDVDGLGLMRVSPDFFGSVLQVTPILGRDFTADDNRPDASPVVMISHEMWQTRFGSDPNVLGRVIQTENYPALQVIGVLPTDFRPPDNLRAPAALWTLVGSGPPLPPLFRFRVFGRLKPGVTLEQAQAELETISDQVLEAGRARTASQFDVTVVSPMPLQMTALSGYHGASDRTAILIFFGAVLCVLMIGIVNLVGLELARMPLLEGELSIRAALGAPRWRLVRFMITKTLIVGLSGGILGTLAASATNGMLLASMPLSFPRMLDIRIDLPVWIFSIALAFLSSLVIAVIPAIRASRPNVQSTLNASSRSNVGARQHRILQDALTATETALALVLVVAAGLLIHSFWKMMSVDMGFDPSGVVTVQVSPPDTYQGRQITDFFEQILGGIAQSGNAQSTAVSSSLPMFSGTGTRAAPAGSIAEPQYSRLDFNTVSAGYFRTLRIPILEGRTFTPIESRDGGLVAIVSESAARQLFPGAPALGKRIQRQSLPNRDFPDLTIVGVVADVRGGLQREEKNATLYIPHGQRLREVGRAGLILTSRTNGDPRHIVDMITTIEPKARTYVESMDGRIGIVAASHRFRALILGGFATAAILLAALGIYTVLSYSVTRRTREIGLRMALGAGRSHLFMEVCRQAVLPGVIGMAIGLVSSYALGRALTSYLFQLQPTDALTYIAVTLILSAVLLVACAIPAYRASRLDPMTALRHE